MRSNKVFKVVVALTTQSYAGQRKLAGIFRFLSGKYLWDITLLRAASELTLDFVTRSENETDGYLLSVHESTEIRQALLRTRKPIVFLDDFDPISIPPSTNASFLTTDQYAIGATAAVHFLKTAKFSTFAFVPAINDPHWSLKRAEGFVRTLARRKKTVVVFNGDKTRSAADALASWVNSLPKPAAIFAAYDDRAVDVINACRRCGNKIPTDVMILGAGDDALVCNSCTPSLSSVKIPFEEHGFLAARELQSRMTYPSGTLATLHSQNDFRLSQRQTTSGKDTVSAIVHDGLAFIAAQATSGIKVPDVVNFLHVSRRLADLRFQQATGKSILQTITETKINEAKRLLRSTSQPISEVASRCGFSNANYFKNVFVKACGTSPRTWRHKTSGDERPVGT